MSHVLDRALRGIPPSREEIVQLLSLDEQTAIHRVMDVARRIREQRFDNNLFLYGFIYFSTFCRNLCSFCFYRKTNNRSPRYRKDLVEVVRIASELVDSGVHLVDLTMGEDPLLHEKDAFEPVFDMIEEVKKVSGIPVMISPGVVSTENLKHLAGIETDWYALYQETHNPELFRRLRIGQSFKQRATKRKQARSFGMLVEDGILLGVGETVHDRTQSFLDMKQNRVNQARVMSFVPQPQTPLSGLSSPPRTLECLCIAVMRLIMPDRLIPASLDVDGINGLKMRLNAGANVVTSIIPPSSKLAGVSQSELDIEPGLRTVPEVRRILSEMGLQAGGRRHYESWLAAQKNELASSEGLSDENRHRGRTTPGSRGRSSGPASWDSHHAH